MAIERIRLVDERERAEVSRRSVEIKSALLSSLSHDLRTPVTAIAMAVDNLALPSLSPAERAAQGRTALAGVNRLTHLFENILEMAQIDAGGVTPVARWVHVGEILQAATTQVEDALQKHRFEVIDHTHGHSVRVDPRLLATALAHLLENAAQYSPPGSTIGVSFECVPERLSITVEDEGCGVHPDDAPHVFERFFRGSPATRRGSGTGMGLAIVQGLVTALNGRVWLEPRVPIGTRFTILVPARTRWATT